MDDSSFKHEYQETVENDKKESDYTMDDSSFKHEYQETVENDKEESDYTMDDSSFKHEYQETVENDKKESDYTMDDSSFKHEYQDSFFKIIRIDANHLDGTECPECNKVFTQNVMMRQHFRSVHQGIRFPCDLCGLKVTTRYKLIAHLKSKHPNGYVLVELS